MPNGTSHVPAHRGRDTGWTGAAPLRAARHARAAAGASGGADGRRRRGNARLVGRDGAKPAPSAGGAPAHGERWTAARHMRSGDRVGGGTPTNTGHGGWLVEAVAGDRRTATATPGHGTRARPRPTRAALAG